MRLTLGWVQISNSFSSQNYFPYSVGILQAYLESQRPQKYKHLLPLYKRVSVKDGVTQLACADVVFVSAYVWNIKLSLRIAEELKKTHPCLIVFGGPQVPNHAEDFLRANPFIDIAVHGEGEQAVVAILENLSDYAQVPSISYIKEGVYRKNPNFERMKDMTTLPSPYLSGIFDSLMEEHPEEKWIVLWETNRGCPFSCTFCDWGSATQSKLFQFELSRLYKEIEWFAAHGIEFIFCADANFGILPRDLDIARATAEAKKKFGFPKALSVQNTKNATERAYQVQKTLAEAGLNKGVTIALQSVDPHTLDAIKRANISTHSFQELQRRFTRDRIETYTDIILALPGETYDSFTEGVSAVIENGQHNRIQFNNLSILPNAEMGDKAYQQKFGMEIVESNVVNIHGELSQDEITETQDLVIATGTMPREDWIRVRVFSWMTALLHFNKLLQIPLILLHELNGISYKKLIEILLNSQEPALREVVNFFHAKARDIQSGGVEYVHSPQWLNIYWPADEYVFIRLVREGKLADFYSDIQKEILSLMTHNQEVICQAITLNKILVKLPFQTDDIRVGTTFNIQEFYKSVVDGEKTGLIEGEHFYNIDRTTHSWSTWDDWFREVVWWGNKKGAYLYGFTNTSQLAGHT